MEVLTAAKKRELRMLGKLDGLRFAFELIEKADHMPKAAVKTCRKIFDREIQNIMTLSEYHLSCGCSVMEGTGHAVLDGKLLKLCRLHVEWMFENVAGEREDCAKLAEDLRANGDEVAAAIRARPPLTLE